MDATASDTAYARLIEPHRAELRAHCRRIVGSPADADDAVQEALVRAWIGLDGFEGRGSLRSWLYRIATNTSLDLMARRRARVLPIDTGSVADPDDRSSDAAHVRDKSPGPDVRCEQRESLRLAFDAAERLLPSRQRAVLILREVLGYSAAETAEVLDSSVAAVNSAMQRARSNLEYVTAHRDRDKMPG